MTDRPDIGSTFRLGREIAEVAADCPCMPKRGNNVATLRRDAPRELHPRLVRGRGDLKGHDSPVGQGDVEVVGAGRGTGNVSTTSSALELTSNRFCSEVLEGLVDHARQPATPP